MSVLSDPRYQQLASIAGSGLGAGPNVTAAILAQFACEKAGEWPPQDNNPGNIHVNAMAAAGVAGLPHGIGDSGAVARFPTPEDGAQGYATYIRNYAGAGAARAAIATDDAGAYITGVTGFGYGTSGSCWRGNLNQAKTTLGGSPVPSPSPSPSPSPVPSPSPAPSPTGGAAPHGTADQWNAAIACFNSQHPQPIHPPAGFTPTVSAAQLPDLVACANQNGISITLADLTPYAGQSLSAIRDALAAQGTIPGAQLIPDIPGAIVAAAQAIAGAIAGGILELVIYGAIVTGILLVGYLGVKRLADA